VSRGYLLRRAVMVFAASWIVVSAFSSIAYAATQLGMPSQTDTGPGSIDTPQAAGYAVGILAGYVGLLTGIAYLRDPLRKARRRARPALSHSPPQRAAVKDVSALAQDNKKTAIWRLVVQLIGSCIAAYGAYVFLVPHWYVYLVIGLAVVWAGGFSPREEPPAMPIARSWPDPAGSGSRCCCPWHRCLSCSGWHR
jgi:hypothetical protein